MVAGGSTRLPMATKIGKAIFSTQLKHEPSMCMVAPKGITISETSRLMPVCSATSILVGIVATDEQVPRDTTAGLVMCRNMTPGPRRPPPNRANRGNAVNTYTRHRG